LFTGDPAEAEEPSLALPVTRLAEEVSCFLADEQTRSRLAHASEQIGHYQGVTALARHLENP
jgi:hypothetical protein